MPSNGWPTRAILRLAQAAPDRRRRDDLADPPPPVRIVEAGRHERELALRSGRSTAVSSGMPGHAAVEHDDVEAVGLAEPRDLLGVPDEHGRRRVEQAARRNEALRVGELERDDDVDVLGVEEARGGRGLLLLLDQPRVDDVAVRGERVGDLPGGGGGGRPHVGRLVVVVLEQRHHEDADLRLHRHGLPPARCSLVCRRSAAVPVGRPRREERPERVEQPHVAAVGLVVGGPRRRVRLDSGP